MAGPKCKIEDYKFPTEASVGLEYDWSITYHNAGDASGYVTAAIGNSKGNPASITLIYLGKSYTISPGYRLVLDARSRGPCTRITVMGKVKFTKEGSYKILIQGVHQEAGKWVEDDRREING
jgi:hypothetical protein